LTSALFAEGLLTEDAMAAVARRAPADRDREVAELAPALLHSQLCRLLAAMPRPQPAEPPDPPEARDGLEFGVDGDRWRARADLPVELGLVVEQAWTAARSQVFHEQHPDEPDVAILRSGVTWVDGLVRAAELALQAMDGTAQGRRPGDRYQVLMHINAGDGTARWHMGEVVPDAVRRYLSCDADVRAVIEADGVLVAMSSRLRTVDDRMRAVVEHRDGGCVVPGCAQRRWLHIHHLVHCEDGGPTESSNLCALCPLHHRLHHAGRLNIEGNPDVPFGLVIRDHTGRQLRPPPPKPPDRPPHPPPQPFQHPTGERVDWRYFDVARN
jgi:hypothetical protein